MPRKARYVSPDQLSLIESTPPRRLFIGLLPEADVQSALHAQQSAWPMPSGAMLTRAERLHMTLHFLGDVDGDAVPYLQLALNDIEMDDMALDLRKPEVWGVAVVRPDDNERLGVLRDRLCKPLRRMGLPVSRKWTPHVTLARNTEGAVPPPEVPTVHWAPRDFALIWSRFEPSGRGYYEVLGRYPATGPSAPTNAPCSPSGSE
jgi:2'-5' RNA ligase